MSTDLLQDEKRSRSSELPRASSIAKLKSQADVEADLDLSDERSSPEPPELSEAEEKRIWRKVDLRLMPILSLLYLMSFMDRGNIGNAKLVGLTTQLNLTGDRYNVALTMYFIPYCIFETPANLVVKKFHPSKWLPGITVLWGVVMTLMGLVKTYPQLIGVRVCLGLAEAGLFPGIVYYLTLWYPRYKLQYRLGLFIGAAALSGAFSGLFAYGISFMAGVGGLEGWSWIFILEGIATVLVGIFAALIMYDFPATAFFLTEKERTWLIRRKKFDNSSVGEEEHFEMRHVLAAFTDWQVWVQIIIFMATIGPLYGITLFLPSIIKGFGFNTAISQLLTVPPYVTATAVTLVFAHYSDKMKLRSPFIIAGMTLSLIGYAINISDASIGAKYFGTFLCVAGTYAAFPAVIAWLGNNLSGQYKRAVGMAWQIGVGNFSGAISSNVFRAQDAPRYIVGHGIELMFIGLGFIAVPLTMLAYTRINADRARRLADGEKTSEKEVREMGDRALEFRYTL